MRMVVRVYAAPGCDRPTHAEGGAPQPVSPVPRPGDPVRLSWMGSPILEGPSRRDRVRKGHARSVSTWLSPTRAESEGKVAM
jgi:hypothetical protein